MITTWEVIEAALIEAAHEINAQMPLYVVQTVSDALSDVSRPIKDSRLLLLGIAYKANVHDTRESPSLEVFRQLIARGGAVTYCDPWVPRLTLDGVRHESVEWSPERMKESDCVVVLTPHRQFLDRLLWHESKLIVDTRNIVASGPNVKQIY